MDGFQGIKGLVVVRMRHGAFLSLLFCMVVCRHVKFPTTQDSWRSTHAGGVCGIGVTIIPFLFVMRPNQRVCKVLIFSGPYFLRRAFILRVGSVVRGIIFWRAKRPHAYRRRASVTYQRHNSMGRHAYHV